MKRRILSIFLAAGLVASVFATAAPVAAQAPEVPAEPNIVDPRGDANGHSSLTGQPGPFTIGAADYLAVWFTHDADNLYVHIHTVFPGFTGGSIWYSIFVDPGVGDDCVEFRAFTEHEAVSPRGQLRLSGDCGDAVEEVEFVTEEGPEDEGSATGLHTLTVPRSLSTDHLADGKTLAGPNALSRYFAGTDDTGGLGVGIIDDTEVGSDYTITGEEEEEPKKKKQTTKGKKSAKGKKGGKQKRKAPPVCAEYEPGEEGAEAETTVVTDAATEEKPVEQEFEFGPGIPENPDQEHQYLNVQVDSSAKEAGLYVRFEFADYEDMDLFLLYASGNEAARAAGYNPVPVGPLDGTGNGGHSEMGAEQLDGIKTPDCQGYTVDLATFQNMPGAKGVKLWLGEGQNDPAEDGGGLVATVFSLF